MRRLLATIVAAYASLAATQTITPRTGWTITADSFQPGNEATNVLDGNTGSIWHTQYSPTNAALPHAITIDMKKIIDVNGLTYLPRQDASMNGNIGQHKIEVEMFFRNVSVTALIEDQLSSDSSTWTTLAFGTYYDDKSLKTTPFTTTPARYVRLTAQTEAGGRGPWTSAAEVNILSAAAYTAPAAIYDPATRTVSRRVVTNTQHDMFCPGISLDAGGRIFVTGGNDAPKTSIYDSNANTWIAAPNMKIARGYQSSATLSNGNIFTIGGSWSGGQGDKNGEVWNAVTNTWSLLPGCPVAPMLTADAQGVYRSDNHGWLFGWKSGSVFQAGPSKAMNWYTATGTGAQKPAGLRGNDPHSMNGNAIMYDAVNGKLLTVGGAPNYQDNDATSNAHVVTIGSPGTTASVAAVGSMANRRAFHNSVVLPDGKVLVTGGEVRPVPFSDAGAVLTPELFNPATSTFSTVNPEAVPRTYHSWSLLLPDATVISGGGGLCGTCSTNHPNAQIFSPAYLFNADGSKAARPVIDSVSATSVAVGTTMTVTTNSAVTSWSLVRYASVTHSVNTDQRRVPLTPEATNGNTYTLRIPSDSGVALPGWWMLYAMNAQGVPSISKTITIRVS
ncbi:MAG: hypothetical protein Q9210_002465 [Variospora velana]